MNHFTIPTALAALTVVAAGALAPSTARAQVVVIEPVAISATPAANGWSAPPLYPAPRYEMLAPAPPVRPRRNTPMLALGAASLGVGYVAGLSTGFLGLLEATPCALFGVDTTACGPRPSPWLMLPLLGPWLALTDPANTGTWAGFAVIDGLLQTGGLVALIAGAATRAPDAPDAPTAAVRWAIAPVSLASASGPVGGVAVMGSF